MRTPRLSEPEARLLQPPKPARFSAAELEGLPEPVQRHLAQAITPGTPLAASARLRMRGRIKVGRWLPFRPTKSSTPTSASCGSLGPPASSPALTDMWTATAASIGSS